ncbi:hypothetical protein GH714_020980 [Hevea brasiliensis]|uniref:Uncharacterized protein n=1 Tax=Hevea brasiliensis TaxID=3981 RepID=A0A6A6LL76_HEVBR|nr:hypothetical protein GH714_020980 [Hevea brasiliensis]
MSSKGSVLLRFLLNISSAIILICIFCASHSSNRYNHEVDVMQHLPSLMFEAKIIWKIWNPLHFQIRCVDYHEGAASGCIHFQEPEGAIKACAAAEFIEEGLIVKNFFVSFEAVIGR